MADRYVGWGRPCRKDANDPKLDRPANGIGSPHSVPVHR